jgi:serine protease Do
MDPWSKANIEALNRVKPAVVHVQAVDRNNRDVTLGTGVVLDHYHVISSGQIVGPNDEVTIKTYDGKKYSAELLAVDPLYFLAVLRVSPRLAVDPPVFASDDTIHTGMHVLTVGFALGYDHSVCNGIVSSNDRTVYRPERFPVDGLIITTANVHPGNAGGAIIDLEGRVLGINGVPWHQGLGLCLQTSVAMRVANQIIEYGEAVHPYVGFSGTPEVIDPTLVQLFDLPVDRGVLVQYVSADGPARRAGIEERDLVVRIEGKPVKHVGFLRKYMANRRLGDEVTLTICRNGELFDVRMRVEEIPRLRSGGE